jgi:hypothetical protein
MVPLSDTSPQRSSKIRHFSTEEPRRLQLSLTHALSLVDLQVRTELDYCEAFLREIRKYAGERPERVVELSSIKKALAGAVEGGIPWPQINTIHVLGRDRARSVSPDPRSAPPVAAAERLPQHQVCFERERVEHLGPLR